MEALAVNASRPDAYIDIEKREQRVIHIAADVNSIKDLISKNI
jgi:hypothetical protein